MAGATGVLLASLYVIWSSGADTSLWGVYASFTAGVLAWGWQEISLYTGFVTGPRKHRCAAGCSGWRHFGHAIGVNLWLHKAPHRFIVNCLQLSHNWKLRQDECALAATRCPTLNCQEGYCPVRMVGLYTGPVVIKRAASANIPIIQR